jgi:hypothetical protein
MADRKITELLSLTELKSNTLVTVVDLDEASPEDRNKKIAVADLLKTFEAAFTKNSAFNKNFGGDGSATTVARSDHEHNVDSLSDAQLSGTQAAGSLFYYNGSLWTDLPIDSAKEIYSIWVVTGSNLSYVAGTVTIGNTLILTSVAADAGFPTSQILSLDAAGNVDKIPASGGGTTNFLRADGSWAAPPGGGGGGIVNGGSSTQNGATYTVNCGSNQQYKESVITDDTTATWTISNLGEEALLAIHMTSATSKGLTLSATGMVFINLGSKVATTAAASTLALTIPGGANITHEILLTDTGFTDGGDKIIHVSLI